MKNYRFWTFLLLTVAFLLGSSAVSPLYSDASNASVPPPEADRQELAPGASSQTAASRQPAADEYLDRLSLNVARRGHTSVALRDGRVAIIGGQNEKGPVGEVEILDAQLRAIKVVASLRVARSRPTATLLLDGRVLIAGGWNQKTLFDSTELFNPETNSLTRGPRLRKPRAAHTTTVLQDGRILITGGNPDGSAEIFDPATNHTTLLKSKMTAARSFHAAALLGDGNVLIVGGVDQDGGRLRTAEVFDAKSQTFSATIAPMKIKRVRATLRALPDGKVQVIGGDLDGTMEVYDAAQNKFGAAVHLTPTANIFSTAKVLRSPTRAAFIDSKMALDDGAAADPSKPLPHYSIASKKSLDNFDEMLERSDYSTAEMPGANRAVIAGGVGKGGEYVRSVVMVESSQTTITTDKSEYRSGEQPVISGSGFQPNETISIVRQEARPGHRRKIIEVVADENGNFTSNGISAADFQQGVTYTLTAMGAQSADVAQTSYNDILPPDTKPKTPKLSLPVLFRDASFELEEGLLVWEMQSGVRPKVAPPEISVASSGVMERFDFADIEDKPQLGFPLPIFPDGIDVQLKSDSYIDFSASVEGDLLAGNLKISQSLSGKLIFQVEADEFEVLKVNLPPSIDFNISLGDFSAGLRIGIVARLDLEFNEPGTIFTTTLNFDQSAAIEFTESGITPTGSATASVDFDLVQTTGGCIKLSVGPEVSFEATIEGDVCDFGVEAAANLSPFIKGCLNLKDIDTCPQYEIEFSVGIGALVEGTLNFCIFTLEEGADTEFFTIPLPFMFSGNLNDTTPPSILCPANIVRENDIGQCGATVSYVLGVSDGACPQPTIECTPSGSFFPVGTTTVTCTATDGGGNKSAPCSFTITVNDTQVPTIDCPVNITDSTVPGQCGKTITYNIPTGADNCGVQSVSCSPDSGTFFNKGTTVVICTVTDTSGNDNTCGFTVTINDTENPTITCPGPITTGTDPNVCTAVVNFNPNANDNCPLPKNAVVCSPSSGTAFAKGTTTVNCTVTDGAGLTASCSFTVTVNDTQGPTFVCPSNVVAGTTPDLCTGIATYVTPKATDNCGGSPVVTCSPPSGMPYPKGVTTVTCSSTDAANNTTMCSFTITINDTQPPAIACPPAQTRITARPGDATVAVTYPAATASDNCPGVTVVCSPPSGATFPRGVTTVTCTATDAANNQTSCSFTVTVFDVFVQDDSSGGSMLLWNSLTGDYRYYCAGATYTGRGVSTRKGNAFTLSQMSGAHRVTASVDASVNRGTASLQVGGVNSCPITDRDIRNNTCQCQ